MIYCKNCQIEFSPNHGNRKVYCSDKCKSLFTWREWANNHPDRLKTHHQKIDPYVLPALEKYGEKCKLCGSTKNVHVHHIQPRAYLGTDDLDNLVVLCRFHHIQIHKSYNKIIGKYLNFKELFTELS